MSNPCFVETTPSPPELCQRLCISSSATPIPENYYETSYSTIFSLDVAPQGTTNVHPVATMSSDENYWPSTYSNSSGASPNSVGYYSPSSVKGTRSPAMSSYNHLHHSHHHHHHHGSSNHIDHGGYYVPQYEKLGTGPYDESYFNTSTATATEPVPVVRVVKRRNTANKKERRRTLSINSAFTYLRDRIPNVPADTKLSKIKTLRLATSYITYLTRVLEGEDTPGGFRAELVPSSRKINAERRANMKNNGITDNLQMMLNSATHGSSSMSHKGTIVDGRKKGRTGWPQEVWRNALKTEPQ